MSRKHHKKNDEIALLRKHLRQALRQWKMYAEMEEDSDLENDDTPEADMYREALAVADESLVKERIQSRR